MLFLRKRTVVIGVCLLIMLSCSKSSKRKSTIKANEWYGASCVQDSTKKSLYYIRNQHGRHYRKAQDNMLTQDSLGYKFYQVYSYSFKKTGEHGKAMKLLNKAVEIDPAEAMGYRAWCMLYYYRHYEKAIADIDTLIARTNNCMEPTWGEICLYNKALALYQLDKYQEALDVFNEWKKCEEDYGFDMSGDVFYHFYTARCLHGMGKLKQAVHQYKNAIKHLDAYASEYNYYLAMAYYDLGQKELACRIMHEVLENVERGNTFVDQYIELFDEIHLWMPKDKLDQWGC